MFGLGLLELAVIVGVVVVLFGASGAKKMLASARSIRDAKRDLTSGALLNRLVDDDAPPTKQKSNRPS